ncbi:MAG: hypothetical protein E7275_07715 [Pseudobutyrivibrio sp.]|uniref:hypothetical protein n=1 Tax=Pseudobutyrivibrio sp. TaxID=2014367 RepID=UPI0025CBA679|nr:hypothetical protein [Pseudobutyrivibrio sp.]MBE5904161.1 hypothetical protein [Pseudobutyrivibrio sp.]
MNIKSADLNINHHKHRESILGNSVQEEKKTEIKSSVDASEKKSKRTRHKGNDAYKVDLSKEGKAKSEGMSFDEWNKVIEKESAGDNTSSQEKENIELNGSDALTDLENRMKSAFAKIRSGETLSAREEDWLNGELTALASRRFNFAKNLKLSREDAEVLYALRDNIEKRQKIFNDMMQDVNPTESKFGIDLSAVEAYVQQKEMEDELKVMQESLKDEDEEDTEEKVDEKDNLDEEFTEESENLNEKVKEDPLKDEKKAAALIEKTRDAINDVSAQQDEEAATSVEFNKKLEKEYYLTMQMLESDEYGLKDKANALEKFASTSLYYASNREIQNVKAQYDAETMLFSRILFEQFDDLKELIKRNPYKVNVIDQDTVIKLLQK